MNPLAQGSTKYSYGRGAVAVSLLSVVALAALGFHPYAEDGGLYVAGIKELLDPGLYPGHAEFVVAHLRFSPFAAVVAALARVVPLPWVLLAFYGASVWATLFAGWMLAARCFASDAARCGAVTLLACWLSLPIAGTSLMLMDPYVTARSVSTPLALMAVAWAMDALAGSRRGVLLCAVALVLALVHPLMAGYAVAAVIAMFAATRRWRPFAFCALALAIAGMTQALAPMQSAAYRMAAMTRYYWFPLRWEWYEQLGLIAPLALIYFLIRTHPSQKALAMGQMALVLGGTAVVVALAFSRAGMATHLVARMQPLRCFQMVYVVMILLLGAWVGERWLGGTAWRWGATIALLGGVMFFAQRQTYPASQHFEWPGASPGNAWVQAFVWISRNTPRDAVFALNARYITRDGEDAQGFRGIAERSALPDYSKDGGEASITPWLAEEWAAGVAAQTGLDEIDDEERASRLRPLGVAWVVLQSASTTAWTCPYRNDVVKVCRLP